MPEKKLKIEIKPEVIEDNLKNVLNDQHFPEKSTLADKIKVKAGSLKDAIGVNRRFYFIKELFNNNANDYDKAVRFIDNLNKFG